VISETVIRATEQKIRAVTEVRVDRAVYAGHFAGTKLNVADLNLDIRKLADLIADQRLVDITGNVTPRLAAEFLADLEAADAARRAPKRVPFTERKHIRARVNISASDGMVRVGTDAYLSPAELNTLSADAYEIVDESETPPLARKPSAELQGLHRERSERLTKAKADVDAAAATVTQLTEDHDRHAARVHRGDKSALKDREATAVALEAGRKAEHAARAAHQEGRALLQPQIDELDAAVAIAKAREEREAREAARAHLWRRFEQSHLDLAKAITTVEKVIAEQQQIVAEMGGHQMDHRDVLEPFAVRLFYECSHLKTAHAKATAYMADSKVK
jgi:hypothetical protein